MVHHNLVYNNRFPIQGEKINSPVILNTLFKTYWLNCLKYPTPTHFFIFGFVPNYIPLTHHRILPHLYVFQ